jgi:DNA-binding response OmpR family regulator
MSSVESPGLNAIQSRSSAARPLGHHPGPSSSRKPTSSDDAPCILLVEDDLAVLDTFARMLRLEGYDVLTAARPEAGLHQAERSRPDAILLDFRMPLLDGLEFLRRLRSHADQRSTPVAIVTGDYFLDDAVTAEIHELDAMILFKPLWLEQLVDLARTLITKRTTPNA